MEMKSLHCEMIIFKKDEFSKLTTLKFLDYSVRIIKLKKKNEPSIVKRIN